MKKKSTVLREIVKWSVVVLVLSLSLLHIYGNKAVWAPLDAYCPFGGLESLWKLFTQGNFLEKTQPSNLVLGTALLFITLLFGGIFCGWICPLGTLQDGLNRLGRFLRIPQLKIPEKYDKWLRWLRLPVLVLVLLQTFQIAKLWFADYDPFRIIFGLHWIAEPSSIIFWGWIIGAAFIILSLVIRRFWCRYLCPLGILIQGVSMISWFRIRWHKSDCLGCDACSKNCPLGLSVQNPKLNSTSCNNCLECVAHCPKPESLKYQGLYDTGNRVALVGVTFFAAILLGAQMLGWWNPQITGKPEDIKGWMTLGTIAETYHIPLSEIKKELKLPASATADTQLRSFEKTVPHFEMDMIRNYVAARIGKQLMEKKDNDLAVTKEKVAPTPIVKESNTGTELKGSTPKPTPAVNSTKETKATPVNVKRDPEEIRGTMTLSEVSEGWSIPMGVLLDKLGVAKDIDTKVPIRELESYGINGMKVREAVKAILNIQ